MWRLALGVALLLPLAARADDGVDGKSDDESAVHVDCPPGATGEDCAADEVAVPDAPAAPGEAPAGTPAAPAAVKTTAAAPAQAAFATVQFRNDVGKKLRLVEAQFTMDGQKLPVVLSNAERGKSYVIVSSAMKPGPHVVTARLTYQGDRGVFSYMKGYKLNVRSEQVLTAPANRAVTFTVVGRENTGLTVPLDRRVVVSVEEGARR